jgi:hypothetical protein
MFAYSDPTGTGFLEQAGALQNYREIVEALHQQFHAERNSAFTLREAFDELTGQAETAAVRWKAFPVTADAAPSVIDRNRFGLQPNDDGFQDEYVEWRVEKNPDGSLARVTFITEFVEYFQAFAALSAGALKQEVQRINPGANPTNQELFGANFNADAATPRARVAAFLSNLKRNPWNNGERGILCLTQRFNTMAALFNLLGTCGVPKPNLQPEDVCGAVAVDGACGPDRNSDPSVCAAAQSLARNNRSFAPQDPCGIRIFGLDTAGRWTVNGQDVDINNEAANQGLWKVTRNGRRATFNFQGDIRVDGGRIQTGAELSRQLIVGAEVIHALNTALPEWARLGQEGTRGPVA